MLNNETINRLMQIYSDDAMVIDTIKNTVMDFEEYHYAIYKMEHFIRFKDSDMDSDEYKNTMEEVLEFNRVFDIVYNKLMLK